MALTINLPEHIQTYIRRQVEEGRFTSEEAVIADAVEQVMDEYRWEEDEDLLEAIAEADRGEASPGQMSFWVAWQMRPARIHAVVIRCPMTSSIRLDYTNRALRDIRDILQYTQERWGDEQEERYRQVLRASRTYVSTRT